MTIHEAKAVIAGADSRSEAYYRGDSTVKAAVDDAFRRTFPGTIDLGDDNPALVDAMAKALNLQTPGGDWFASRHKF